jgi:hypothetical protein
MPDADNAFQLGRRAFITTIVAILLNPLSVAFGYFINQYLQRENLRIEYINHTLFKADQRFDHNVLALLRSNPGVLANLRGALVRLKSTGEVRLCTEWLDGKDWQDECLSQVEEVTNGILGAVEAEREAVTANIKVIESWQPPAPLNLHPMAGLPPQLVALTIMKDKAGSLSTLNGTQSGLEKTSEILKNVSKELERIREQKELNLTGEMEFVVGVLNDGGADAVVTNRATLAFGRNDMILYADAYAVVKAHSFQEITYKMADFQANESANRAWKKIVKERTKMKYALRLETPRGKKSKQSGIND